MTALMIPFRLFALAIAFSSTCELHAEIVFHDDFSNLEVDQTKWTLPAPEVSFLGRTQQRLFEYPDVSNGVVRLRLDRFNPFDAGNSFYGTEIITRTSFSATPGVSMETRARVSSTTSLGNPTPGGLDAGFFTFVITPNSNPLVRDEIDFELLTNDIGGSSRVLTNVFEDDDFSQGGKQQFVSVSDFDMTDFNTYRTVWETDRIQWYINDQLVREETDIVPDQDMPIQLNLWAPNQFFPEGYNPGLTPVFTEAENETFFFEVDYVTVSAVPEPGSVSLLACGAVALAIRRNRRRASA